MLRSEQPARRLKRGFAMAYPHHAIGEQLPEVGFEPTPGVNRTGF
jgi:hypothetical protein